jgi:hypothetical protein
MISEPILYPSTTMVSDSSTTTTIPSSFSIPITEKLTKSNYRLWKAQILPPIWAAQLEDFLYNTSEKPAEKLTEKTGATVTEKINPSMLVG